jgi:tellurite resistance protein TehA-like permease
MRAEARARLLATADRELSGLSPSYFALVMATGIVSIGAHLLDVPVVDVVLFAVNIGAYVVLWVLTGLRLIRHRRSLLDDLTNHRQALGFLTIVAGTCVLGAQMIVIAHDYAIATGLLIVGGALWVVLVYTIFTALTIKPDKPSLAEGINGGWLLAVVATQAIAVLIALLSAHWHQPLRLHANFVALSMWLWGGMHYIWIISLIFYRYVFFRFSPTTSLRRTGSTWARWRSRSWPDRCSSATRPPRPSSSRCGPSSRASPSSTGPPAPGGSP